MNYPRYRHDNEQCVFLMHLNKRDWYFWPESGALAQGTLLVRWGDVPEQYARIPLKTARTMTHGQVAGTDLEDLHQTLNECAEDFPDFSIPRNVEFAEELRPLVEQCLAHPKAKSFRRSLVQLSNIAKNCGGVVKLYRDFAPLSLGWSAGRMCGGLIYHGKEYGPSSGAPTFSVDLSGDTDSHWSLHS